MHIGVFADIEGSFGIWRMRQCRVGTAEWQYGRACLTADVNAVVQGAFDGGAQRVTVKDTHETGFNCLRDKLDARADYIGGHYVAPSFFGDVAAYDMILYVAIHAASGTENAFFPHTHYGIFSEVTLNGSPVCEMDVYGAYIGEFGTPIGFVSGEDTAVAQATAALPWAVAVVVDKRQETYEDNEKSRQYLDEGRRELRRMAAVAVQGKDRMQPLVLSGPLHFQAEFRTRALADKFNTWGFAQTDRTVEWESGNMIDGFEMFNKLTFFPRKIYPFRRPLTFLMRNYHRVKSRYFGPEPNSEGALYPF